MTNPRLRRLFTGDPGRCLVVAIDHGFYGLPELLTGIDAMPAVVDRLVAAGPDALLLTPGQAPLLQCHPGRHKPSLLLRADVTNVHGARPGDDLYTTLIGDPVDEAVRLDAAAVVVNHYDVVGVPDVRRQSIEAITAVRAAAAAVAMPVIVEPFVYRPDGDRFVVVDDVEANLVLIRQAVELGADAIKADPTDADTGLARVLESARVPVLVRGGARVDESALLARTGGVLAAGAAGLVYGRNVIQHPRPAAMVSALRAMVHDQATPEDARHHLSAK